jgi:hypothetical protein
MERILLLQRVAKRIFSRLPSHHSIYREDLSHSLDMDLVVFGPCAYFKIRDENKTNFEFEKRVRASVFLNSYDTFLYDNEFS